MGRDRSARLELGPRMLAAVSQAIERRDPYTRGHSARVTAFADAVARQLGWPQSRLAALRAGGSLHDVGKLAVPRRILSKAGPLTPVEFAQVRVHPSAGARLISPIASLRAALPYVLYHHERWDGTGYPEGRAGEEIPEEARLLAVADAFDAMTSTRPYRQPWPLDRAFVELERCAGSQFDPRMVESFLAVWSDGALARSRLAS